MIAIDDIRSLTDFQRNAKTYAKRLNRSGRPMVLTWRTRSERRAEHFETAHKATQPKNANSISESVFGNFMYDLNYCTKIRHLEF